MKFTIPVALALVALAAIPLSAGKKKDEPARGMLEKMEAVPCGATQKGLTGLGSFWASAGITHVSSNEKLCPQYLLRTDEMDYRVRPEDMKHAVVLPVGHEVIFRIDKNRMLIRVPEGDRKMRPYQVVAMDPTNAAGENAASKSSNP
jgi:hypothetical protein